jgi:hypothetical protein
MKIYHLFFLTCIFLATHTVLRAQNDNDGMYITEARLAIEKYKDYDSGIKSLNKLSAEGKKNPIYSLYMAKAYEGKRDDENTLLYYQQYANQTSLTPELMEKIADLRYKQGKIEENDISGSWSVIEITGFNEIDKSKPIFVKDATSNIVVELNKANIEIIKKTNTRFEVILNKKIILVTFFLNTNSYKFSGTDQILYWEEHSDEQTTLTNFPSFGEKSLKNDTRFYKKEYFFHNTSDYDSLSIPVIEKKDNMVRDFYIHIYLKKN